MGYIITAGICIAALLLDINLLKKRVDKLEGKVRELSKK